MRWKLRSFYFFHSPHFLGVLLRKHMSYCMCRGPFRKPNGWLTWGLLGVVLSPVVIGLTVTALTSAGYEVSPPSADVF